MGLRAYKSRDIPRQGEALLRVKTGADGVPKPDLLFPVIAFRALVERFRIMCIDFCRLCFKGLRVLPPASSATPLKSRFLRTQKLLPTRSNNTQNHKA